MASSDNPLKRALDEPDSVPRMNFLSNNHTQSTLTPPNTESPDSKPLAGMESFLREPSPALSTSTLSSLPASANGSVSAQPATSGTPSAHPAKRRKLTAEEKAQLQMEKDAKAREREQKKAQKEAENAAKEAVKEEERRVKAEKKRQEAEVKEEKQRVKDLAKKQKEEEEAKKQRAQLRLGSFFAKASPAKPTELATILTVVDTATTESNHQNPSQTLQDSSAEQSSRNDAQDAADHDYRTFFLPFTLPSHATLPPGYLREVDASEHALFDETLRNAKDKEVESIQHILGVATPQQRGNLPARASAVIERLQDTRHQPIDLTEDSPNQHDPSIDLANIDIKHLHFCEDVRPPYTGSYTKVISSSKAAKAARNPTFHVREDTHYGYDSEAEWEEPEEGEDLLSDGEEEVESVGSADEMDGFVDDGEVEDDPRAGRRFVAAELEPVSSGMCWEDCSRSTASMEAPLSDINLSAMRLEWLIDTKVKSINPLSDSYWAVHVEPALVQAVPAAPQMDLFGRPIAGPAAAPSTAMKPPRAPLQPASNGVNQKMIVNAKSGEKGPIMAVQTAKTAKAAAPKLTGADFDEFKEAVDGSNLTKSELLKALKQRFPKFTNESIKETLTSNFARIGPNAADKKWRPVATA